MLYQWRARMSLHRNDIAMFGVVRTSRRRYSPLSFRPASDGRVDSAMAAAPRRAGGNRASSPTADIGRRYAHFLRATLINQVD